MGVLLSVILPLALATYAYVMWREQTTGQQSIMQRTDLEPTLGQKHKLAIRCVDFGHTPKTPLTGMQATQALNQANAVEKLLNKATILVEEFKTTGTVSDCSACKNAGSTAVKLAAESYSTLDSEGLLEACCEQCPDAQVCESTTANIVRAQSKVDVLAGCQKNLKASGSEADCQQMVANCLAVSSSKARQQCRKIAEAGGEEAATTTPTTPLPGGTTTASGANAGTGNTSATGKHSGAVLTQAVNLCTKAAQQGLVTGWSRSKCEEAAQECIAKPKEQQAGCIKMIPRPPSRRQLSAPRETPLTAQEISSNTFCKVSVRYDVGACGVDQTTFAEQPAVNKTYYLDSRVEEKSMAEVQLCTDLNSFNPEADLDSLSGGIFIHGTIKKTKVLVLGEFSYRSSAAGEAQTLEDFRTMLGSNPHDKKLKAVGLHYVPGEFELPRVGGQLEATHLNRITIMDQGTKDMLGRPHVNMSIFVGTSNSFKTKATMEAGGESYVIAIFPAHLFTTITYSRRFELLNFLSELGGIYCLMAGTLLLVKQITIAYSYLDCCRDQVKQRSGLYDK